MKGPPRGPGGEDITWPDQVAPRGRKASSTRKIKPQTSNLCKPLRRRSWAACAAVVCMCGPSHSHVRKQYAHMKGACREVNRGRCSVPYEHMVYENHEFGHLTEKLACPSSLTREGEKLW